MSDWTFEEEVTYHELDVEHLGEQTLQEYYDNIGNLQDFEDAFAGRYEGDTPEEAVGNYIFELTPETEIPERFGFYINWEAMGRDAILNGDVWVSDSRVENGLWAIFYNI